MARWKMNYEMVMVTVPFLLSVGLKWDSTFETVFGHRPSSWENSEKCAGNGPTSKFLDLHAAIPVDIRFSPQDITDMNDYDTAVSLFAQECACNKWRSCITCVAESNVHTSPEWRCNDVAKLWGARRLLLELTMLTMYGRVCSTCRQCLLSHQGRV